jgi:hypothetical protein
VNLCFDDGGADGLDIAEMRAAGADRLFRCSTKPRIDEA